MGPFEASLALNPLLTVHHGGIFFSLEVDLLAVITELVFAVRIRAPFAEPAQLAAYFLAGPFLAIVSESLHATKSVSTYSQSFLGHYRISYE
jgi:hypothetical protein